MALRSVCKQIDVEMGRASRGGVCDADDDVAALPPAVPATTAAALAGDAALRGADDVAEVSLAEAEADDDAAAAAATPPTAEVAAIKEDEEEDG